MRTRRDARSGEFAGAGATADSPEGALPIPPGPLLVPGAAQNVGDRVVAFVAGVLVEQMVEALEGDLSAPGARVGPAVVDRELVQDRLFNPRA